MGKQVPTTVSFQLPDGQEVVIETGKLATQADGAVVVRIGNTMLFASVVSAKEVKEGQSFFPLSVDYQEKFAAAGRIPGNFFRREARLSNYEILVSRLVDRALRPLFPDGYMNETQIIINLISGEEQVLPDAYAALAASAALAVSDIPFAGPISEVRVARINGEFKVNPSRAEEGKADLSIIVAATMNDITMVEGEANEVSEEALIEAMRIGHEAIKTQIQAQLELARKVGEKALNKREVQLPEEDEDVYAWVKEKAEQGVYQIAKAFLDKKGRKTRFEELKKTLEEQFAEEKGEEYAEEKGALLERYFDKVKKSVIRNMVMDEGIRLDGRQLDEIRPIWCEVDYLPSAHGSAIFNRGETQSLTTLTMGTKLSELMEDNALLMSYEKFILHYNFPAYSVGEIKPMRGPGRREVGHANLAARALRPVLPDEMPYTLRIVSDIMESNGSSSMATVCAGSLAMMDAGIKIKSAVSGIAMGLISDGDKIAILSDILGDEDALGDMDFKVTGTEKGITACQMDIKIEGMSYELLERALEQAKRGRLHILNEMNKTISAPREDYKPHAPRIVELVIDKSFIGAIIGPGGKIIQQLQEETGTTINIEEVDNKGLVNIASSNAEGLQKAVAKIKEITFTPEVGDVYEAVVKTVMPYGVFVDFAGKSGLLHVSEIAHERVEKVEEFFKEGDKVKVKLIGIDPKTGKIRLSRKALLVKPDGSMPDENNSPKRQQGGDPRDRRRHGRPRDKR